MSLQTVSDWLYASPLSQAIQNNDWVIPTVQSVHILAIAVLFGSALVLNLRLAGVTGTMHPPLDLFVRYQPRLWAGLGVLVVTGLLMVVGEPERVLMNAVFWWKMGLLTCAVLLTVTLKAIAGSRLASPPLAARVLAAITLVVWVAVMFCGSWIAYAI